jgi:hypothetical protein
MRVIDLLVVYLGVGVACAVVVGRLARGREPSVLDRVFVVFMWPIYVPALLAPAPAPPLATRIPGTAAGIIRAERAALIAAVDAVANTPVRACLPTREQLETLVGRIESLDAKVAELDGVLARDEFDAARAASAVHAAEREGGSLLESAQMVKRSIEQLQSMRAAAAKERDELLALCGRLRTQLTVVRFAERDGGDELGGLVNEILVRVEAVGASLEPAIE